jgi:hypothetical protein
VAFVCLVLLPVIISKQSFLRVIRPVYTELANSFVSAQALRPCNTIKRTLPKLLAAPRSAGPAGVWQLP